VWAGKTAREAIDAAMLHTAGEAEASNYRHPLLVLQELTLSRSHADAGGESAVHATERLCHDDIIIGRTFARRPLRHYRSGRRRQDGRRPARRLAGARARPENRDR